MCFPFAEMGAVREPQEEFPEGGHASVYNVVLQKSFPAHIRQLVLHYH